MAPKSVRTTTITFFGLYCFYSLVMVTYNGYDGFEKQNAFQLLNVSEALKSGREVLSHKPDDHSIAQLKLAFVAALKAKEYDFFLLRKRNQTVFYENRAGKSDPVVFPDTNRDVIFQGTNYDEGVIRQGDYYLAVGFKTSLKIHLLRYFSDIRWKLLFDCIVVYLLLHFFSRNLAKTLWTERRNEN